MKHIKELLAGDVVIGEVDILPGDNFAQHNLRHAAQQASHPVQHLARLTLAAESSTSEAQARELAPGLARWATKLGIRIIVSPEQLSTEQAHHIAARAIMLAAFWTATASNQPISVLAAHGTIGRQGLWLADAAPEETLPAAEAHQPPELLPAISYTHHRIHPTLSSASSVEFWVAGQ